MSEHAVETMTFEEYVVLANAEYIDSRRYLRRGQVFFNELYGIKPYLANRVRANAVLDPFYQDDNISAFLKFVAINWNNHS
jgi:hypothetical protein